MLPLGRLDLTDTQHEQVRAVMEQNREATQAAGARVREVRRALQDAVTPFLGLVGLACVLREEGP